MTCIQTTAFADDACFGLRIRRARKAAARILKRLNRAVEAGDEHRVRGLIARILNSYPCKLAAIDEANRARPTEKRLPRAELFYRADQLDAWRGSREPVRMRVQAKKAGGARLVMSFGIENRALQIMVRWVLHAWVRARLLPQQHVLRGGRAPAVIATKSMIEEGNHKYAVELDFQNMHGSISVNWLKERLPIPPAVVDAVCIAQHMNVIPVDHIAIMHMQGSRLGIPQGSAVSPLLSELVVASILADLPAEMPFQTYVDNIACPARNEEEMRSRQEIVVRLIEAHPSGSFRVRSTEIKRLDQGFHFLGYQLKKRRRIAVVGVSDRKQDSFVEKVEAIWSSPASNEAERVIKAYRLIQGWTAGHSLWRGARRMQNDLWQHVTYLIPYPDRLALGLTGFSTDGIYP